MLSTRATYIHIGAVFGTIMALERVDAHPAAAAPDDRRGRARASASTTTLAAGAKRRSKHNTFLAVPTTFIMISNHFPTATYGNHYAVPVLGALILVGWGSGGALLRRA